jgi:hypothetical protein
VAGTIPVRTMDTAGGRAVACPGHPPAHSRTACPPIRVPQSGDLSIHAAPTRRVHHCRPPPAASLAVGDLAVSRPFVLGLPPAGAASGPGEPLPPCPHPGRGSPKADAPPQRLDTADPLDRAASHQCRSRQRLPCPSSLPHRPSRTPTTSSPGTLIVSDLVGRAFDARST